MGAFKLAQLTGWGVGIERGEGLSAKPMAVVLAIIGGVPGRTLMKKLRPRSDLKVSAGTPGSA